MNRAHDAESGSATRVSGFAPLRERELAGLLTRIESARVAVIGDYCLDVYWFVDDARSEPSLETGLPTHPVREHRCSLGGAGNLAQNVLAMGCRTLRALGVVGNDPWGRELVRLLEAVHADTSGLLVQEEAWSTLAYTKPHLKDGETNRFDFGNFNRLARGTAETLLARLRAEVPNVDIVIVNQQVREGIHSRELREGLVEIMRQSADRVFIVDSRHYSEFFTNALLKINAHEAARLCGIERAPGELVLREEVLSSAERLFRQSGKPVFVTRGDRGVVVRDASGLYEVPGIQVLGRTDPVGAGDTVLAGISLGLAAGGDPVAAAQLGNVAAAVTIQKLRQTGTASPEEIMEIGRAPDYVYRPELAEDPRRARILEGTEVELVRELPPGLRVEVAIFDHDGTISTLRQGWEGVMQPMMVRAVLGPRYRSADESLYRRVVEEVRGFIDRSTGVQTLAQMQGLVRMVRDFGCVPEPDILDEFGYKRIYNETLMRRVRDRRSKLERGELAVEDFVIKNAVAFVRRLHAAGVRMYLASGTDQDDVAAEARALGYADLFKGGIYGSVGDVRKEAKRIVVDRILREIGEDRTAALVTFGDGPVEIRETRKRGAVAIGVASDEVRRFGLNPAKRARLIRAGADVIVPDFSQMDRLLALIGIKRVSSGR